MARDQAGGGGPERGEVARLLIYLTNDTLSMWTLLAFPVSQHHPPSLRTHFADKETEAQALASGG